MPAEVETMFYYGATPWHGLGVPVGEELEAERALIAAGLDWTVDGVPVGAIFSDGVQAIPDLVANVRNTDRKVLGVVSNRYQRVQNKDAFEWVDLLVQQSGLKYTTAGSLQGGKQVWMLAKLPEVLTIFGDAIDQYVVFTNGHDGKTAIQVAFTPVRVVCMNTLNMALRGAKHKWYTRHIGTMEQKLDAARTTLGLAETYGKALQAYAADLVAIKFGKAKFELLADHLYPVTKGLSPREESAILSQKVDLLSRFERQADLSNFRKTGWGAINAVADHVAHVLPIRNTKTMKEKRFIEIVDGHKLLDAAAKFIEKSAA